MSDNSDKLTNVLVPDEWSTFDEDLDKSITNSAQRAFDGVKSSQQNLPSVKQALAKFVADWKELLDAHPDLAETLAADRVEKYFNDLAASSGSGACSEAVWHEINMGMVDLQRVDYSTFVEKCAEEAKCSVDEMNKVIKAFVGAVKEELKSKGRAKVNGFGSFFQTERAFQAKGKGISNRESVDFRCCAEVKKHLTEPSDYHPHGLGPSEFGRKVGKSIEGQIEMWPTLLETFVAQLVKSLCSDEGKNAVVIEGLGEFSRRKLRAAYAEDPSGRREQLPPSYSIAFLASSNPNH